MKKSLLLLILATALSAKAQYYDQRNHVLNHSSENRGIPVKKNDEKVDVVQINLDKLNEILTLDSFQQAVIKQLLTDNMKEEERVVSQDAPDESKREQIVALREKLNTKIQEILNPDQKNKFEEFRKKKKK